MKYIVKRSEWCRGGINGKSKLLNRDGFKCCLGFVGEQCGFEKCDLLNRGLPFLCILKSKHFPKWGFDENKSGTGTIWEGCACINDSLGISDSEREEFLQGIFLEHGDEIEFVD